MLFGHLELKLGALHNNIRSRAFLSLFQQTISQLINKEAPSDDLVDKYNKDGLLKAEGYQTVVYYHRVIAVSRELSLSLLVHLGDINFTHCFPYRAFGSVILFDVNISLPKSNLKRRVDNQPLVVRLSLWEYYPHFITAWPR